MVVSKSHAGESIKAFEERFHDRIVFDEETHTYTRKDTGEEVPSVTQIMWPLSIQAYGNIPLVNLERAAERGKAIHTAIALYEATGYSAVDAVALPYFQAYQQWRAEMIEDGWSLIGVEVPFYENILPKTQHCGTIDQVWRNEECDDWMIVDIKTGKKPNHLNWAVQCEMYADGLGAWIGEDCVWQVIHLDGGKKPKTFMPGRTSTVREAVDALQVLWNYMEVE